MKVAYISVGGFSCVDISLLAELQKNADVYYFVPIMGKSLNASAINIGKQYPKTGLFKAEIYPELQRFETMIDLDKMYVLNSCGKHGWSIRNFWVNIKLFLFLIKEEFDIIHLTIYPYYFEFWKFFFRKKIVLTVHDPFQHSSEISKANNIYRKLSFSLFSNFILLNRTQKQEFIDFYHLRHKNIYDSQLSCYDYLHMYSDFKSNIIPTMKYILFFGRITAYKGLAYLLPAMQKIHQSFPDVQLVIAGSGKFPFDISSYQNLDYIKIYNRFISDEEQALFMRNSLFVICPYTDATQSGVVMSAFAFNKVVVATNVGALPEMVVDDRYGIIIPPCSQDAIEEAVCNLLSDDNKLKRMEKNIQEDYSYGENSWKKISKGVLEIYKDILNKRK